MVKKRMHLEKVVCFASTESGDLPGLMLDSGHDLLDQSASVPLSSFSFFVAFVLSFPVCFSSSTVSALLVSLRPAEHHVQA